VAGEILKRERRGEREGNDSREAKLENGIEKVP